jgi:hypothetical protein
LFEASCAEVAAEGPGVNLPLISVEAGPNVPEGA